MVDANVLKCKLVRLVQLLSERWEVLLCLSHIRDVALPKVNVHDRHQAALKELQKQRERERERERDSATHVAASFRLNAQIHRLLLVTLAVPFQPARSFGFASENMRGGRSA